MTAKPRNERISLTYAELYEIVEALHAHAIEQTATQRRILARIADDVSWYSHADDTLAAYYRLAGKAAMKPRFGPGL